MATYSWHVTTVGADWNTAGSWSPSGPPGSTDTAVFSNLGTSTYTATVGASDTVTVGAISIGSISTTVGPNIVIDGSLTTGKLTYTTATGKDASSITINAGGFFEVSTSLTTGTRAETITIQALTSTSATLELGSLTVGNASTMSYSFSNAGLGDANKGILEYASGFTSGATTTQTVKNVAKGDEFVINGANFTGDTVTYSGTTVQVKSGATVVFTMDNVSFQSGASNQGFIASGDVIQAICYARGTNIQTPSGEMPVERLRPGKQVTTLVDGDATPRVVKWLGHRRIDLTTHPRPETVAPIRILQGAFADGTPHRDLLLSPDHAIFVDGVLVCARQLINGSTIRQEAGWTAVDYYHVELESHAILLAEGLPAESYLDTGNRNFFGNSGLPLMLHPDLTDEAGDAARAGGSCAPFAMDAASVQPIWQRLAERAAAIGKPVPQRAVTEAADLHLVAKGRVVKPIYHDAELAIFVLPRGASEVRLASRAQSPAEARPWLDDRRKLGVQISRIVLRGADLARDVPIDHPDLQKGWWAVEQDGLVLRRWTDGDAVLPLPETHGGVMLEIYLAGKMTYLADTAPVAERRAA